MPAKHSARPLHPARIVLSAGAAVLVMLVMWVAVRAVGPAEASRQPTVVLPSMPQIPIADASSIPPAPSSVPSSSAVPSSSSPSPSLSPSSASPSPSVTTTTTAPAPPPSPTPVRTTTPPPPPPPPPAADFAVAVSVSASWQQGYVAAVRVKNSGKKSADWTVTVSHSNLQNLRLLGVWGARGRQQGDNVVFTGGPLTPGGTASFGYQTSKTGNGNARPAGCSVVGGDCGVR